jgi:hypothetical protein
MKRSKMIEVSEKTFDELLETERKYLLLLEELNSFSSMFEKYQESIESFLKKS